MIDMRQYPGEGVIANARSKGAVIHTVTEQAQDDVNHRMTPYLLTEVNDDMVRCRRVVCVPVLPYRAFCRTRKLHHNKERPRVGANESWLASSKSCSYRKHTQAAFVLTTLLVHVAAEDAPFGLTLVLQAAGTLPRH
ncbi:hypothetical protein O9992_01200 [Vibrio lentus]|nr:hypothetical protein [Vibrio lentus]